MPTCSHCGRENPDEVRFCRGCATPLDLAGLGFWKRLFHTHFSPDRRFNDFLLGVIAPLACVVFDPIIFRSFFMTDGGLLRDFRLPGYFAIGVGVVSLSYYLVMRRATAFLAGILWGSFAIAIATGLLLIPLSIFGVAFSIVALLGLTPLFCSFAFYRNASQCWRASKTLHKGRMLTLGLALYFAVPIVLQISLVSVADYATRDLQSDSESDFARGVQIWKVIYCVISPDRIVHSYEYTRLDAQRDHLDRAYRAITGHSVNDRLSYGEGS